MKPPGPAGPRRWRGRLALAAASVLLAVLAAEGLVRGIGLGPTVYAPRRFEPRGVPFTPLRGKTLVYQPGSRFSSVYDPAGDHRGYFGPQGRVTYRINRFGLRGPEPPSKKEQGTFCVVCLGDSFTFGEGVHHPDTYPARLARLLAASGQYEKVEVINAGVQGYGTGQAVDFYRLQGYQFEPDVVILGFVLNDATDFALTIEQNEARTRDMTLSTLARLSRLWEIVERGRAARRLQNEFFETTRRSFRSEQWNECKSLLEQMEQLSRIQGFRFLVVLFPIYWEIDGNYPFEDLHALVDRACRDADCEFVDLLNIYRTCRTESLWVHPADHHPNELAHRLAAKRVARYLTEKPGRSPTR